MDGLKLSELKRRAKEQGVAGYSKMNKQQLIDVLSLPVLKSEYEVDNERIEVQQEAVCKGGVCPVVTEQPAVSKPKRTRKAKPQRDDVGDFIKLVESWHLDQTDKDKLTRPELIENLTKLGILPSLAAVYRKQ